MLFKKAIYVDMDGTLSPGTEMRNRKALQTMVNDFTAATGKNTFIIPWDVCCGQDEQRIHAILIEKGLDGLDEYMSAPKFQDRAKIAYGEVENVDYSFRKGMISILTFLKEYGVTPVLVTNSPKKSAEMVLKEGFDIHSKKSGKWTTAKDVFPLIITKTDVLEAGMQPKPSSDPFVLAEEQLKASLLHNYLNSSFFRPSQFHYQRKHTLILEDSAAGTKAGFEHTRNKDQVVQFVDDGLTPPCDFAGHHVNNMAECVTAMCGFYGIAEPHTTTPLQDTLMQMALR